MAKHALIFFALLCISFDRLFSFDLEKITDDSLIHDPYTEHVEVFQCLFALTQVHSFLEFGMGRGTKYFLDHCDHVTSLEISIESRKDAIDPWFFECIYAYRHYDNWKPLYYKASSVVDYYNLPSSLKYWELTQNYAPTYLKEYHEEINAICQDILKDKKFDVIFVDPGIFTRVHLVNAVMGRADIIVAHDTENGIYGWAHLYQPLDYERIDHLSYHTGTTVWIKKDKTELIQNLKKALQALPKRH